MHEASLQLEVIHSSYPKHACEAEYPDWESKHLPELACLRKIECAVELADFEARVGTLI